MSKLEKQLIVLMQLGISIKHESGHRWIDCEETEYFDFNKELKKYGILLNSKQYGSVKDTIEVINYCIERITGKSLLKHFCWREQDCIETFRPLDLSRINFVSNGNGGLD